MKLQEDDTESPRGTIAAWSPSVTSSARSIVMHDRTRTEPRPHLLFRRCAQGRKHGVTPAHRSEECTKEKIILVTFADFAREARRAGKRNMMLTGRVGGYGASWDREDHTRAAPAVRTRSQRALDLRQSLTMTGSQRALHRLPLRTPP